VRADPRIQVPPARGATAAPAATFERTLLQARMCHEPAGSQRGDGKHRNVRIDHQCTSFEIDRSGFLPSVGVRPEIQLSTAPIGYVGVELRGGQIRVAEHLLNRAQIGAALEQMRGERMP
jgi:hypothetical protein